MSLITLDRLKHFVPQGKPELLQVMADSPELFNDAKVDSGLRVRHFMAQVATETRGLQAIEENLNYSAERLHEVWPSRFPTVASALPYQHNPQALANRVYRNRLGNGSTSSNDGWNYRGSGMMQTTGRDNFRRAGHEADPQALRTPLPALVSALKFWVDHDLNAYADRDDVTGLRRAVNGGSIGLADCRLWLARAKPIFV